MRVQRYFAASAIALLLAGCAIAVAAPAPSPSSPLGASTSTYGGTEARIFNLINAERQHQGLPALVYNAQLDRMAKIQAENMARFQKMAHTIPESQLPTLGDRARYAGYRYAGTAVTFSMAASRRPELALRGLQRAVSTTARSLGDG